MKNDQPRFSRRMLLFLAAPLSAVGSLLRRRRILRNIPRKIRWLGHI